MAPLLWFIPYVPPILSQLLDLISPTKINISEPRFESYIPWDMANCLPWYNTYKLSVLNVRLFYCKKNEVVFCLPYSHVHTRVTVKFKGSKFPCTGSGSQVRDFEYGFWGKKGKNHQYFYFKKKCYSLIFICKTNAGHFAMSHGSYDLNPGSEIMILAGDIRSRIWLGCTVCIPYLAI